MMFRILLIAIVFFSTHYNSSAQRTIEEQARSIPESNCVSVMALSSYIKQNFATDSARVRAIYVWITDHISYDVDAMLAKGSMTTTTVPLPSADEILTRRSGVCQGYTDLFVALSKACGINAVRVGGYTKRTGEVSSLAHAWVALKLNGKWQLFDPTWGAGFVRNEKFVKRFSDNFYNVAPEKFIEQHMPFDPLYQLLAYPFTHAEFIAGKTAATKTVFNYSDSIQVQQQLPQASQMAAELRRLEAGGYPHFILQERRMYLKNVIQSSSSKNSFNEGILAYRTAVALYNGLYEHRKKQFSSITDADLKTSVDSIEFYIKQSRALIAEVAPKTDAQWESKTKQTASIDKLWVALVQQKDFVTKYLATDKEKRKQLFLR